MSIILKLAAIADLTDRIGDHDTTNNLTQLMKNAQIFDALRTLLNPSEGELGEDEGFWKRLTRGWRAGKFDRRLGLALAINEEREKLNKQILSLAQPLKDFAEQMTTFYEKVKSGGENYTSQDFKSELNSLKERAVQVKRLIDSRKLRKALDQRNRLNSQQIAAIEKIKGIDDTKKQFLISVLRGEIVPDSSEESRPTTVGPKSNPEVVPGMSKEEGKKIKELQDNNSFGDWLAERGVGNGKSLTEGLKSNITDMFRPFVRNFGISPVVILEALQTNSTLANEARRKFPAVYREMHFWALNAIKKDEMAARDIEKGITPTVTPAENPKVEEKNEAKSAPLKSPSPPATSPPTIAPTVPSSTETPARLRDTPAPGTKPSAQIPLLATPPVTSQDPVSPANRPSRRKRDIDIAKAIQSIDEKTKRPGPTLPEETVKREPETAPADDLHLAFSAITRTERQITRLGRVQKIRKLSE